MSATSKILNTQSADRIATSNSRRSSITLLAPQVASTTPLPQAASATPLPGQAASAKVDPE